MKKTLQLFITFLTVTLAGAQAVDDVFTDGDYSYIVTSVAPNEAAVTGSSVTVLDIPSSATDASTTTMYAVTSIGVDAFKENTTITSLILPSTVTTIGSGAFTGCTALAMDPLDLTNLTDVGAYAFFQCALITSVIVPGTVTFGDGVLRQTGLTSFTIPSGWATLPNQLLRDCLSITSIDIPSTISSLSTATFRGCTNLTQIQVNSDTPLAVPNGNAIATINAAARLYVPSATAETAYEADAAWLAVFDAARIIEGTAPAAGDTFTTDDISYELVNANEVTVTGSTLAALVIPETVTNAANGLEYTVTAIAGSSFYNNATIETLVTPSTLTSIGAATAGNNGTFRGTSAMVSADFSASTSLTEIPVILFRASAIQSVILPASLVTYGANAFRDCTSLASVEVQNPTPAAITADVFNNLTLSGITLTVPLGTYDGYAATAVWQDFGTILGVETTKEELGFSLYPNPTNGIVSIKNSQLNQGSITVYDINGRALLSRNLNSVASEINISNLASGLYIFRVQTENGEFSKRILKQ